MNFSYSDDDTIKEGIKRLAEVIKEELSKNFQDETYPPEGV